MPPGGIVRKHFLRKKEKNPGFSLRGLANALGISPAYLSRIMNGHKPVPESLSRELAMRLDMDDTAVEELRQGILLDKNIDREAMKLIADRMAVKIEGAPASSEFEEMPEKRFVLLEDWYYLPILDLTTCKDFQPDAEWIAARLGLKVSVAADAWTRLIRLGCVKEVDGAWRKSEERIRFPTHKSLAPVRRYHRNNLKKAAEVLVDDSAAAFERRLIKGGSVATNKKNIEKARKILDEALFKAMEALSEGEPDEVYHLAIQLFPLTKPT